MAGETLAKKHCTSCHLYTPPDVLDRTSWLNVLSAMKKEMDLISYPIEYKEWIDVQRFYLDYSPPVFGTRRLKNDPVEQKLFYSSDIFGSPNEMVNSTMLFWNAERRSLHVGQESGHVRTFWANKPVATDSISNIPVDAAVLEDQLLILGMGTIGPNPQALGSVYPLGDANLMVDGLHRPVDMIIDDLDGDREADLFVASFGSKIDSVHSGKLSWFEQSEGYWQEHVLQRLPGAIQVSLADLDKDGEKEVIGLFAEAREVIMLYKVVDNEVVSSSEILSFLPIYGTNSFDITDINDDGLDDLLVTHGDNDDYSQVFKPYHGVRIFLNKGNLVFEEEFFFPINGASTVKSADFNMDGKMDFVVVAMYPDYFSRPWESVLYFEQGRSNTFKPYFFEQQPSARWLRIEVADVDSDGDEDLICTSHSGMLGLAPPSLIKSWNSESPGLKVFLNSAIP